MMESLPRDINQTHQQWFYDYCRKVENDTLEVHNILNNEVFINWLITFSKKKPILFDEWVSISSGYTEIDLNFIKKLKYFYDAIRMYADKLYIAPYETNNGYVYYINCRGITLQIGQTNDDSKAYFYQRIDKVDKDTIVINFDDMQQNKKGLQNDSIKVGLSELATHIQNLINNGVPSEEILKTTEETIKLCFKK